MSVIHSRNANDFSRVSGRGNSVMLDRYTTCDARHYYRFVRKHGMTKWAAREVVWGMLFAASLTTAFIKFQPAAEQQAVA